MRETVTGALSAVATEVQNLVRAGSKVPPSDPEQSRPDDLPSCSTTTTEDQEDLIKIEFQQTSPDHPSVKSSGGKAALKTATLSFNTISMIGRATGATLP